MAIFRAGKRIGNMDIRIGLPRDRSLDNVEGDKRLDRRYSLGVSTRTSIGRFITQLNRGEGVARANRFLVKLFPPRDIVGDQVAQRLMQHDMVENVELMCTSARLPHRDVLSTNFVTYGPGRKMPYAYNYGANIQCMFMADKFLRQRAFFETWQGRMHNLITHNLEYYDNYVGTMEIYQLGSYRETDKEVGYSDNYRMTYGIRLHEVYPETIGEIQYQAIVDDMIPMDIPITFAYRTWENITLDQINDVEFGKSVPDMPHIEPAKSYGGLIGGVLGQMPPEMKRAAKTVIDNIKRDIPIGKGTGGRVFPPFHRSRIG